MDYRQPVTVTVESLSRDVMTSVAPSEMGALAFYLLAFKQDPSIIDAGRASDDETGFGAQDIEALTPHVVAVASAVLAFLGAQTVEMVAEPARGATWSWLTAALRRRRATARPVATITVDMLSPEQLARVHTLALKAAKSRGLSARTAEEIANQLVAALATGSA